MLPQVAAAQEKPRGKVEVTRKVEYYDVRGRTSAERKLEERERRVAEFDIRPLTSAERDRFGEEWREVKTLFVDSPPEAVLRADRLLGTMMEARGFPVGDFDRRYEDLTVDHALVAKHYREGHDIAEKRGDATTEEMRRDAGIRGVSMIFTDALGGARHPPQSGRVEVPLLQLLG